MPELIYVVSIKHCAIHNQTGCGSIRYYKEYLIFDIIFYHDKQLSEIQLWENMSDEKYGNYYRNVHGIIEHSHYHLGQILLVKKLLLNRAESNILIVDS